MKRLPPPPKLAFVALIWFAILGVLPLANLFYTLARYGTTVTPTGGAYNFPPQACFPPFLFLAIVGLAAIISRQRSAIILLLAVVYFIIAINLLGLFGLMTDLIDAPQIVDIRLLILLVILIVLLVVPAIPVHRWLAENKHNR